MLCYTSTAATKQVYMMEPSSSKEFDEIKNGTYSKDFHIGIYDTFHFKDGPRYYPYLCKNNNGDSVITLMVNVVTTGKGYNQPCRRFPIDVHPCAIIKFKVKGKGEVVQKFSLKKRC